MKLPSALTRVIPATGRMRLVTFLGVLTIAFGSLAAWSAAEADEWTGDAAAKNGALSDNGRTSEVKGQMTTAVNTVFSYNYADVSKTEKAAKEVLTGDAVRQYDKLFALVRQQAPQQKTILTTTVTDSAVTNLDGDHARVLIFADQTNTRTDKNKSSYSATVFAIDALYVHKTWKINNIDTFDA
ncbi:hypothetical protein [Actinomadura atramentaria]|uniref:hypothetical protein n=1 Tax=Actinomadura atramentaria TaxID=1990 RepID=UPI00037C1F75|nr:hypothetical protein [Actinomadura atramentaria]